MNDRSNRVLQSLRRAQQFLDAAPLASNPRVVGVRKRLDLATQELSAHAVEQDAAHHDWRGSNTRGRALRRTLRVRMRTIVQAARAYLGPAVARGEFRLPEPSVHTEQLLAAAGGLSDAATRHREIFLGNGMPDDFVARLDNAAQELRENMLRRGKTAGRKAGATKGIREATADGVRMLALLDTVVGEELQDEQERLAEWRSVTHVRRFPQRPPADAAADAPAA